MAHQLRTPAIALCGIISGCTAMMENMTDAVYAPRDTFEVCGSTKGWEKLPKLEYVCSEGRSFYELKLGRNGLEGYAQQAEVYCKAENEKLGTFETVLHLDKHGYACHTFMENKKGVTVYFSSRQPDTLPTEER